MRQARGRRPPRPEARCSPARRESSTTSPRVIRRGQRMGAASTEIEFHARGRTMHLAVTSARLELAHGQPGTVLVVEDTTELLRAQRQLAWKEVAQRVAHEIKNPLTPIALSAERIGRHLDRAQPDSPGRSSASAAKSSSPASAPCARSSISSPRSRSFPAPQPRACDMNQIAEEALALFAGRLEGITVQRDLEPGLPWSSPILRPFAAPSPTSSTTPPRPCRAACCASSPSQLAQRRRRRRRSHRLRHRPRPHRRNPRAALSALLSPPSSAAPDSAFPSPPRSSRSTAAPSAPRATSPRAHASCCACH